MIRSFLHLAVSLICISIYFPSCSPKQQKIAKEETGKDDWFIRQRIYPFNAPDYNAYKQAVLWRKQSNAALRTTSQQAWQYAGPENLGGRVVDVEMPPNSTSTYYVCAASGGVFKSTNSGTSWTPIFDNSPSLSIGDLAIAPSDSNILYCGTGEANAGGGSITYDGAGIFKSVNAGTSWSYIGLDSTRNTGRIAIDPKNPDRVFAATMGDLFGKGADRGLYRTLNGGTSWQKVLFANDSTGAIDVVIHPQNPDTIYACLWTRERSVNKRSYGGPASGIYRSYNGGDTWTKLTNGMPAYPLGRIGIDISKSNPNILYATITDANGTNAVIRKTIDNGNTWTNVTGNFTGGGYSYWFGRIKIDPVNPDIVYEIDFYLHKTTNGGTSWSIISGAIHVDQHEVYINPSNTNNVMVGNDGGFYVSSNGGNTWTKNRKLPIMQFYTCEMDEQLPQRLYGGSQDNGVNRTLTGATGDWSSILGGDGFVVLVDPVNSSKVYAESQYGDINTGTSGINASDPVNWNTPFVLNPLNSASLYYGSNKVYKSINKGVSWSAVSPRLTRISGGGSYPDVFGTITTIAVAPSDTNVIYIGTDDGYVQVTTNGGDAWNIISGTLPLRWVTHVEVDPRNALNAYVTLSGYRYHDNISHIYHTANGGNNWTDIGGNLPDVPANDVILDTIYQLLYLATDIGVYSASVGSTNWQPLGTDLPLVPVTDLRLHYPTRTLIAATYGRSMYKIDLSLLTTSEPSPATQSLFVRVLQNPVTEHLALNIYCEKSSNAEIKLYDISGKVVQQKSVQLTKGNNNPVIPLYDLPGGIYFVHVFGDHLQATVKICVQKH